MRITHGSGSQMTYQDIAVVEHAARSVMAWVPESDTAGYRYRALIPALSAGAIILLAAVVLVRLLSA
jgi:hypothetical protein